MFQRQASSIASLFTPVTCGNLVQEGCQPPQKRESALANGALWPQDLGNLGRWSLQAKFLEMPALSCRRIPTAHGPQVQALDQHHRCQLKAGSNNPPLFDHVCLRAGHLANLGGADLLGQRVFVLWPLDATWYCGYVTLYDSEEVGYHEAWGTCMQCRPL